MTRSSLRPTAAIAFVVFGALVAPGCASDDGHEEEEAAESAEEEAVELLQEGIRVGRDGDLDRAAELLDEAARTRPGFVDPLMFLANVEERREDLPAARAAYLRALQADPTFSAAGVALALTYVRERRLVEARAWLERCIDVDPGCEPALFNLGTLAEQRGDDATAIAWHRLAGVVDMWTVQPLIREGLLHLEAGRIDDAKRLAERAYTRKPEEKAVFEFVQQIRLVESK